MMKRLKYGVFGIVSLLSFFNLYTYGIVNECTINYEKEMTYNLKSSPGTSQYPYQYNAYFNLVNVNAGSSWTRTNTGGMMCFATMDVNDIHNFSIYLNGSQVGDIMGSYNVILTWACYEGVGNWEIYNNSGKFKQIFVQDFNLFNGTSSQCQSKFDLVPSSDLSSCQSDLNSCQSELESLSGCSSNTGLEWSALYINDIQHIGAGLINLTIPEEFERDYIYTGNGEILDIDVKGYNVDTAYIDGLITTQRTLPNNTDFNNTISGLLPLFVPGIVIIFFLYFIFRFIKKVF